MTFIETSAELISQDRRVRKPKIVLLGRPEAVDMAALFFTEGGVDVTTLDVGFFDEQGARELVFAYAHAAATAESSLFEHKRPAELLVSTYFEKIESALTLGNGELWTAPAGRSFAGYAPVLAALGALLPEIDNFAEAQNRLSVVGAASAWAVIESVLRSILARDQGKVVGQLRLLGMDTSDERLYSAVEQEAYLLQTVQGLPLSGTGQVRLPAAEAAKYAEAVRRFLPEHPFLKDGRFSNDVIASFVVATAIMGGSDVKDEALLQRLGRQPFLWRSIKSAIGQSAMIDGAFLGYVLSSFWSDPLTSDENVLIRDVEGGGGAFVEIVLRGESVSFTATTPLHFFGQMRNVNVETTEPLSLVGIGEGAARTFSLSGTNRIVSNLIDLRASELRLQHGRTWVDAVIEPVGGQLELIIRPGVEYGWSDRLASVYPFSNYASTIKREQVAPVDELVQILEECEGKTSPGIALTLLADFSVQGNDYLKAVFIKHGAKFQVVMATLISEGYGQKSPIQAAGPAKIRVKLDVSFHTLAIVARTRDGNPDLVALTDKLRERLHSM